MVDRTIVAAAVATTSGPLLSFRLADMSKCSVEFDVDQSRWMF